MTTAPVNCTGHVNPFDPDTDPLFCTGTTCIEHPIQVGATLIEVAFHRAAWAKEFAARVQRELPGVKVARQGPHVSFVAPIRDYGFGATDTELHWSEVASFFSSPEHPGVTNGRRNTPTY